MFLVVHEVIAISVLRALLAMSSHVTRFLKYRTWANRRYRFHYCFPTWFSLSYTGLSDTSLSRLYSISSTIQGTLIEVHITLFASFLPCVIGSGFVRPFSGFPLRCRAASSSLVSILPGILFTARHTQVAEGLDVQAEVAIPVTVPVATL